MVGLYYFDSLSVITFTSVIIITRTRVSKYLQNHINSHSTTPDSKMDCYDSKLKSFAMDLCKVNAIKFGNFKMKVGLNSPIYCDLRVLVSYPKLLETLGGLIVEKMGCATEHQLLCGVPYTALPIATVMSVLIGKPMVMRRKEAKSYGTKKLVEGVFNKGDNCLIIEDIMTSGSSILETVKDLRDSGLSVTDVVVVLDREQGGVKIVRDNGINVHALLTMTELLKYLEEGNCIGTDVAKDVKKYIAENQITKTTINQINTSRLKMPYENRAEHSSNRVGRRLLKIMSEKQTNLCVAIDLTSTCKVLQLAELLGPHICVLKTHVDILDDFSPRFVEKLKQIAAAHNFLIMEDRKFADIGNTVKLQFSNGIYRISTWADLVTAHSLPGKSLIQALDSSDGIERGIFLLAEMSSAENLITEGYNASTVKLAQDFPGSVCGIVGQKPQCVDVPGMIQLTPGIQLDKLKDNLGQQYNTPEHAVARGADIGVVGRGIIESDNPLEAALIYKKQLWEAYIKRVTST